MLMAFYVLLLHHVLLLLEHLSQYNVITSIVGKYIEMFISISFSLPWKDQKK